MMRGLGKECINERGGASTGEKMRSDDSDQNPKEKHLGWGIGGLTVF